jgi:hypothetical protein
MNVCHKSVSICRRRARLEDSRRPHRSRPVEADQTLFMLWRLHQRDVFCDDLCPLCDSRWSPTKRPVCPAQRRRQ